VSGAADALSIARGEVRDGVAAIEHFLQVLASRRVGPKMLARAVPEMAAGCAPLRAAIAALGDALAEELSTGTDDPQGGDPEGAAAVRALLAHADARVAELSAALASHQSATMDARERLALEAVVRRAAGELSAVVGLVDLLGAPVTSETTTIDFTDALLARRVVARSGMTMVHAAVDQRASELVVGDARMILELLAHAVSTVVRAGVDTPRIVVDTGPEGLPVFTVEAARERVAVGSGADRPLFDVALRDELPHEAEVVRAAARHAGIALTIADGGRKVTIAL
jgi:hypothetical protein